MIAIIIVSVFLTISICLNIFFLYSIYSYQDSIDEHKKVIDDYEKLMKEYKNTVVDTYKKLKEVDDRNIFEKDDDVGFAFSSIKNLIERLSEIF